MTTRRYFDNTMLSGYKGCPRFYFLRHHKGWRLDGTSPALAFGLAWHDAQDVIWQHMKNVSLSDLVRMAAAQFDQTFEENGMPVEMSLEETERFNPRTPSVAREMIRGYVNERKDLIQGAELLGVEQPFAVPLPVDNTSEVSIWYVGRLDKVARIGGQNVIIEHKTTSEYAKASGFKTSYVESWYLDSQIMGYLYGGGLYYDKLEQVWVDAALVHKQVHDKFRFIPVGHQWGMLESWIQDTKEWVKRLLRDEMRFAAEGTLAGGIFPKQQSNCMGRYGACPMLDICRTQANPEELTSPPPGYIHEKWEPFEILKLEKIINKE